MDNGNPHQGSTWNYKSQISITLFQVLIQYIHTHTPKKNHIAITYFRVIKYVCLSTEIKIKSIFKMGFLKKLSQIGNWNDRKAQAFHTKGKTHTHKDPVGFSEKRSSRCPAKIPHLQPAWGYHEPALFCWNPTWEPGNPSAAWSVYTYSSPV